MAADAESPKASYMASENVLKSILPLETISLISSDDFPRASDKMAVTLTPRSANCCTVSPLILPWAATFWKMPPMSPRSRPKVAAVPVQASSALLMSSPAATPDAARFAATSAAWSSEKAVPSTAAFTVSL